MAGIAKIQPTPRFWDCLGVSIAVLSIGISWNISKTRTLEFEIAEYKLKTGSALSKVQEVSSVLEKSAKTLPIASPKRKAIERELEESNEFLEQAEEEIEEQTEQLLENQDR